MLEIPQEPTEPIKDALDTPLNTPDILGHNPLQTPRMPQFQPKPEEDEVSYLDYIVDAKFTEDEESEVMFILQREMSKIKSEYANESWFDRCELADDEYEGAHTEDDDDSNIKLLLGTLTIDIIASRAFRQTWSPHQFVTLEGEFEDKNLSDILSKRQDILDYIARKKSGHQDISLPAYRAVGKYGVAVLKTFLDHVEETRTKIKVYRPGNQQDLQKFQDKYKKKLLNPDSKEIQELQQLMSGQGKPIAKKETDSEVIYHGAKMYLVEPKKFFARPNIKDFRKHTMISELFTYNWYEIENMVNSKIWNSDAVDEIKSMNGDAYSEKDYDFYTSIVQYDRKGNGKLERYLVTHESMSKKIVRAIHYPYKGICYHAYNIFEKSNSWIGYSVIERMEDLIVAANATITSFMSEQDLAHTPILLAYGRKSGDWSIKLGVPNLLGVDPTGTTANNALTQYRMESPSTDRIAFLQWLFQYSVLLTGVDPFLLSGIGNPSDKRAAKEKVAMNFQASTIRIEDMIITLQKGDASVTSEEEDIVYRFPEDPSKSQFEYFKDGKKEAIDTQFFERPVRYMMTGSSMSFDPSKDLGLMMQTIDFLAKFAPEIEQNLEVKKALLTAVFNNSKGTIEKMSDILLAPLNKLIDIQKAAEEQEQQKIQQFVQQRKSEGYSDEQIKGFLIQMRQQGLQNQPKQQQPQQPQPQGQTIHHTHQMLPPTSSAMPNVAGTAIPQGVRR